MAEHHEVQVAQLQADAALKMFNESEKNAREDYKDQKDMGLTQEENFKTWATINSPQVVVAFGQWEDAVVHLKNVKIQDGGPGAWTDADDKKNAKRAAKFEGRVIPGITDNPAIPNISK